MIRGRLEGNFVANDQKGRLALGSYIRLMVMAEARSLGNCSMGMAERKGEVSGSLALGPEKGRGSESMLQADFGE